MSLTGQSDEEDDVMAMQPEMAAGLVGIAMWDMLRASARAAADAGADRAVAHSYAAWSRVLAEARDDADEIAAVTVQAITQIANLEDEVVALHEENARLRRALAQREQALRSLRH